MKKITTTILLGLLALPALTGCTGKLVPSGSEVDSEVPETIGDYRFASAADLASTNCQGSPATEYTAEGLFNGVFLYSKDANAIEGDAAQCSEYATKYTLSTGDVRIEMNSPAFILTGSFETAADPVCTVDNLDNGEVIQCTAAKDDIAISASSPRIGSQENQEKELKEMMETFKKKAKVDLPVIADSSK